MSLGRIGLTGGLGRKTVANIAILCNDNLPFGNTGFQTSPLSKTNFFVNDGDGSNIPMPYAGKFSEFRFRNNSNWRGQMVLQKNNVDTDLKIEILGFTDPTPQKVIANVPFVAGDLFRYTINTLTIATTTMVFAMLFGGFDVTN